MAFDVTRDNDRLLGLLKRIDKVPQNLTELTGVMPSQTVDEEGVAGYDVVLGGLYGVDGRKPKSITVATADGLRPTERNGRIIRADIQMVGDEAMLVRQEAGQNTALRFITTGLLVAPDGSTGGDFKALVGSRLRYHGAFPITADAADVVGEQLDFTVTGESRVIVDERFGTIRGLPGVPRSRELAISGVVGGPVLVGQINGTIKIIELQPDGSWKTTDVTNSAFWQQKFMDLAMKDATYIGALAAANKLKRRKNFKVIKGLPSNHPDA